MHFEERIALMAALPPDELLRLWTAEQLPAERAIGQIVQNLARLQIAIDQHSQALSSLRAEVARLHTMPAAAPTPRKRTPGKG
jgi:hypothetical protein